MLTRRTEHPIASAVDVRAKSLRMILSAGQTADIDCAAYPIEKIPLSALIADKGYDSNTLVQIAEADDAKTAIPLRSNRMVSRLYDRNLYRQCNRIERFFNRIEHYRRIATLYDKPARSYMAFVMIVCATIRHVQLGTGTKTD